MKKKTGGLFVASILAVATLASCSLIPTFPEQPVYHEPTSQPGGNNNSSQGGQNQGEDLVALANKVWEGLDSIYSAWASKGITGDQELNTSSRRTGEDGNVYEFVIKYSIPTEFAANLALNEAGDKLLVTCPDSLTGGSDVRAYVNAEVYLRGETTPLVKTQFNVLVNAVAKMSLAYIYSTKSDGSLVVASGESVSFSAVYVGEYPQQGAIYAAGEYAMITYKSFAPDGAKVGDAFSISGTLKDYSGLRELDSAGLTVTKLDSAAGIPAPVAIDIKAGSEYALGFKDSNRQIKISGVVESTTLKDGSNSYVYVKVGGTTYTVYIHGVYAADCFDSWKHVRSGATEATYPVAGDNVELTGYVSAYNNNMQVVYAKCTGWSEASVAVSGDTSIFVGATGKVTGSVKDSPDAVFTWTSSDTSVATVAADGTVTGVKEGKVTITGKVTVAGIEYTKTIEVSVVEMKLVPTTVDALLAMVKEGNTTETIYDRKNLYTVTGIIDSMKNDDYGNAVLKDPTSGKEITVYGATTTDSAIFYDASKGGWDFKNPKDAKTTLANVHDGDTVTMKVIFEDYKGKAEIMGVVTSHVPSVAEYDVTVTSGEHGSATVSKNKGKAGEEVEVLPVPESGYVVDKVTVVTSSGTVTVAPNADGKYIFAIGSKNEVNVTFKSENAAPITVHAGTAEDPYTVADAIALAKDHDTDKSAKGRYYITGKVASIATAFSSSYGNVSVNISDDGSADGELFQVYRLLGADGAKLTSESDVEVGDTITVVADIIFTYKKDGKPDIYECSDNVHLVSITKASNPSTPDNPGTDNPGTDNPGDDNPTGGDTPTQITVHAGTAADPYTIADALAVAKANGTDKSKVGKYYITGKVASIATAFSAQYGNISVNLSDDGTTSGELFQAYRLLGIDGAKFISESDVEVGDTITLVADIIFTYHKDGYPDIYECSNNVNLISITKGTPSTPENPGDDNPTGGETGAGTVTVPYSVAQAVALAKTNGTTEVEAESYITGKVSTVVSYSAANGYYTVNISDDGTTDGDQFQCYHLMGVEGMKFLSDKDIQVGDTITVKAGTVFTYQKSGNPDVYEAKNVNLVSITRNDSTRYISLSRTTADADINGTVDITALVTPTDGNDVDSPNVEWSVDQCGTLNVTKGKTVTFTGTAAGTATVTASWKGANGTTLTATCVITVTDPNAYSGVAFFNLGDDGSASHTDGTMPSEFPVEYSADKGTGTLSLDKVTNGFYAGARDAAGNGCIKLGTSSKAGDFKFTVPANVNKVVIMVAGYKANAAKIQINGGDVQDITTKSADGAYTPVVVDTSTNKTVSLTTAAGGYRAMINSIEFLAA